MSRGRIARCWNMQLQTRRRRSRRSRERKSTQEKRPDSVDGGVRDCRSADAAIASPCAPVEDAGYRGQQHIAPVEVQGALVEVREAEEHRRDEKRGGAAHTALEKILQPSAKE